MNAGEDALSPAAAWAEMAVHLAWGNGLCLCFLFADSSAALAQVRQLATDAWQMNTAPVTIVAPATPAGAAEKILTDLAACQQRMGSVKAPVWVEILTVDAHGSLEWDATRATILARLNEARAWLSADFARPLVLCLPGNWFHKVPQLAPDLWHIRAFTARLANQAGTIARDWALPTMPAERNQETISFALQARQQALQRLERATGAQTLGRQRDVLVATLELGAAYFKQAQNYDALICYREALAIARQLHTILGDARYVLDDLAIALNCIGDAELVAGRNEDALTAYNESLAIRRKMRAGLGDKPEVLRSLAISLEKVGHSEYASARIEKALTNYNESLALRRLLNTKLGDTPQALQDIAIMLERIANAELAGGRNEAALTACRESLALARQLHTSLGDTPQTSTNLASALENLRITELASNPPPPSPPPADAEPEANQE